MTTGAVERLFARKTQFTEAWASIAKGPSQRVYGYNPRDRSVCSICWRTASGEVSMDVFQVDVRYPGLARRFVHHLEQGPEHFLGCNTLAQAMIDMGFAITVVRGIAGRAYLFTRQHCGMEIELEYEAGQSAQVMLKGGGGRFRRLILIPELDREWPGHGRPEIALTFTIKSVMDYIAEGKISLDPLAAA